MVYTKVQTRDIQGTFLKVRSYYATIALQCQYINYISAARHHIITAFQVKINLTSCDTAKFSNIAYRVQCSNANQLRCSMNRPLQDLAVNVQDASESYDSHQQNISHVITISITLPHPNK